jgi:hypothetical protein
MSNPWQNMQQSQQNLQSFSNAGQRAQENAVRQTTSALGRGRATGRPPRSRVGRFIGFVFGLVVMAIMFGIFALVAVEVYKRSR